MNEKRFIQLINLHIDGETSPEELEELEKEVVSNFRRREIYQSYCRLQQASREVCNQFGEALAETVDLRKYQILARHSHGLRRGLLYSAGALVAACLSVVAAVALFQDTGWGNGNARSISNSRAVAVEIFEPRGRNTASQSIRMAALNPKPEPFSFFGAFGATRPPARTFQPASAPTFWEEELSSASSTKVIRGKSSFDAPELVSFQFQR